MRRGRSGGPRTLRIVTAAGGGRLRRREDKARSEAEGGRKAKHERGMSYERHERSRSLRPRR